MISLKIQNLRDELRGVQNEFTKDFRETAEKSRLEVMKVLKPGEKAPDTGKIWGKDARAQFEERAAGYRSRAYTAIDACEAAIREDMTAAPSSEAVAVISALSARSKVAPEEIDAVLAKYGKNYLAYSAVKDIAAARGYVGIEDHADVSDLREVQGMKTIAASLTLNGAEKGNAANPSFLAFQDLFYSKIGNDGES